MKFKLTTQNDDGTESVEQAEFYNGAIKLGDRQINLDMAPRDVHTETALTNFATGFTQTGFIWRDVMPTLMVNKQSDVYYQWDKELAYEEGDRNTNSKQGEVPEDSPSLSTDRYQVSLYTRGFFIHAEAEANADAILNLQMAHMNMSMTKMNLASEGRAATLLQATTSFDTSTTLALDVNTTWLNTNTGLPGTTSNPIRDLLDLQTKVLVPVDEWVMNPIVYNAFILHPEVQKYFIQKSGTPALPNQSQLAGLFGGIFGVAPVRMAGAKKLSGSTHPFIWNNSVTGLHKPAGTPTGMDVTTAMRFRWNGMGASPLRGFTGRDGYFVRTFPIENRGVLGGMKTIIFVYETEKLVSTFGGALITGAVGAF